MKHTPGPWKLVMNGKGEKFIDTPRCLWSLGSFVFSKADARLIAAAPELLEALQQAVNELEFQYSAHLTMAGKLQPQDELVLKRLQATIVKATGEG